MRILFTRSNKIVSRLIRRVTKEPVSHCALQIGETVVHANFIGVHPESFYSFTKGGVEIVATIELPDDYKKMFHLACAGWGKQYDFGAMFYLMARALIPWLPKKNLWQSSGMYLCSEWVSEAMGEGDAMITPHKLYLKLKDENV